ncbi:aminodeoxychorismate lyase [Bacillus sp. FJAT-18017]|uniref:aminodeoxychorismate lyase n=1 Tax=Bacillus sp. FJAT-18017 TaxID=1705566 RepID=UPI0006BC2E68|nr:aminodeoxychorismate lyase [Bacillus sp. FJAT-18017]ALC91710.1 aminodeoxychorismate lyase [Bacillus sp. FJAT-18017]
MRINLLSSFAAGMFLTTAICAVVYFTVDTPKASSKTENVEKVELSEGEMKGELETKGYVVQTQEEYDKTINDAKAAAQKQTKPAEAPSNAKPVTKVVINVSDGMTSINVGRALEQAGIVKDAFAFSKDIEKKGLMKKLRPGVYMVDSSMTYDQVISTIFR